MTTSASVRIAHPRDADGIARIHVRAWRETHSGVIPNAILASQSEERRATWWRHVIENETSTRCAVAEHEGEIIGFASAGRSRDDDAPRELELFTILTLAAVYGSGIGSALLDAVLGEEPATLWIAEDNERAQAFYRKNGFEPDGSTRFEGVSELRMVR